MQLATPQAFAANPKLVWEWYAWRRELVSRAAPNPAHYALARLAQHIPGLILVTQNVDGLHQQAGSPLVIELHGNLTRTICARERIVIQAWESGPELPPRCPGCGSYLRPDVVWFGEPLPGEALETAFQAARLCDLFFSIGTSSLVEPAAQLPYMAIHAGSPVVEINPQETPLSASAAYVLRGPAGAILPGLVDQL
jgi:NAD-dependent deacetylase